jgi:DNA-binding NtrC family response regulator
MNYKILIIDDDELVASSLKKVLLKLGYEAETCTDAGYTNEKIDSFDPDIILLDIYLTTHNGLDLLKDFNKQKNSIPVIMITGYADVNIAVSAMKSGAFDFLLKPLDLDQLKTVLQKATDKLFLSHEIEKLNELMKEDEISPEFFGKSKKMQKLVKQAEMLAKSSDTTILIEGESGTGKEIFARYIHQQSPRKSAPFIQINCSAIPKELAESELFGYEKGAFTGAAQKIKMGKFELANNGTILLDEIGELPLDLQVKLLRVLEEKKFFRLGGEKEIIVDVRILAATNRNLEEEIKKGCFREDLFYRLNVASILIPPLRTRKEDIPYLVYYFISEFSKKFDKEVKGINPEAVDILLNYPWKGNARELKNVMERSVLLCEGNELKENSFAYLAATVKQSKANPDDFLLKIPSSGIKIDTVLKSLIQQTLKITNGNQVKAARVLGLSRSKLRYRMEQLGIEVTRNVN